MTIPALAGHARSASRTVQRTADHTRPVAAAFAATTRSTVNIISELNRQISELETSLAENFETHQDADRRCSGSGFARYVRNHRLYDAVDQPAFCALRSSPGTETYYDQRRAAGDNHHQALRIVGSRLVGVRHGCLRHHTPNTEAHAWAHRKPAAA